MFLWPKEPKFITGAKVFKNFQILSRPNEPGPGPTWQNFGIYVRPRAPKFDPYRRMCWSEKVTHIDTIGQNCLPFCRAQESFDQKTFNVFGRIFNTVQRFAYPIWRDIHNHLISMNVIRKRFILSFKEQPYIYAYLL